MIFLHLLFLLSVGLSVTLENWPLSEREQIAIRGQRDAAHGIPLDQITTFGVSLNQQVFEKDGYTLSALSQIGDLLDSNVQTLMVDLYWNEFIGKWQLCPAPFPKNVTFDISSTVDVSWKSRTYSCQPSLTIRDLFNTIQEYLVSTNFNMNVNLIQLLFNLKSISYTYVKTNASVDLNPIYTSTDPNYLSLGNSSLSAPLQAFGSNLFTPTNLGTFRLNILSTDVEGFYNQSCMLVPTLSEFLLSQYNRIFALVIDNEIVLSPRRYNISKDDNDTIFFGDGGHDTGRTQSGTLLSYDLQSIDNSTLAANCETLRDVSIPEVPEVYNTLALKSHFRFIIDNSDTSFDNATIAKYIECGYSPILNASGYRIYTTNNSESSDIGSIIDNFIPLSLWSWASNQPQVPSSAQNTLVDTIGNNINGSNEDLLHQGEVDQVAYKCVVITENGWQLANCYAIYPLACKSNASPNEWIVKKDDKKQYFETYKDNICPEGYSFSIPGLSIEMLALQNHIAANDISYPVWVDMNDITVTNCFVMGGPYANCPYQKTITRLRLARLVAPSFIMAVFILVLIFLEKFFRPKPVQKNRKRHWKRVINEYYKENEYEGVPS